MSCVSFRLGGFFSSAPRMFILNSQGIVRTLATSNGYCVKLHDASGHHLNLM